MKIQRKSWLVNGKSEYNNSFVEKYDIRIAEFNAQIIIICISRAFGLIPSKYLPKLSEIIKILCANDLSICDCAMYELSREQSCDLTQTLGFGINDIWSSGPMVAMAITGLDAYQRLQQLVAGEF